MGNQTFSKINDFDIISKIGEGSFAEVYKVKRKEDGQYYAIKKVTKISFRLECPKSNKKTNNMH